MYNRYQLARKYLHYWRTAANSRGHGTHSPFVFDFILHVLNNGRNYQPPAQVEVLRKQLLQNGELLQVDDLGAGSRTTEKKERSVRQLAASAVKPERFGKMLFRLVRHYQPQSIIELGTSLGITTAYLAYGNEKAKLVTVEGSASIRNKAIENLRKLQLPQVESMEGHFDLVVPRILGNVASVDLAYIDGNHRYAPTMDYFHQFLQKSHSSTILVFDDIHWSGEMEKAWEEIRRNPRVKCTIDIFFLGFVFLRHDFREQQHFTIRF